MRFVCTIDSVLGGLRRLQTKSSQARECQPAVNSVCQPFVFPFPEKSYLLGDMLSEAKLCMKIGSPFYETGPSRLSLQASVLRLNLLPPRCHELNSHKLIPSNPHVTYFSKCHLRNYLQSSDIFQSSFTCHSGCINTKISHNLSRRAASSRGRKASFSPVIQGCGKSVKADV